MNKSNEEQKPLRLTEIKSLPDLYADMDGNSKLYLSPNIKHKNLGEKWYAIQFICSWHRKNNGEVSIILDDKVKIDNLNKQDEMLLVAFYLAKKVMFEGQDIRKKLLRQFIPFVEKMNSYSLSRYLGGKNRTGEIKFLFLGGAKNEFLKLFYDDKNKFKLKKDVEELLGDMITVFIGPIEDTLKNLNIKEIIYEILNNTDMHGRRDVRNTEIPNNIRGLSIKFTGISKTYQEPFLSNQENHQEHYKVFLKNVKQVLVISIFDSGEGIVKKYIETTSETKEADMILKYRKETLRDVFLANVTSSKIPNSGMGLTYVKNNIKKLKGLLSIRTSTLELFLAPTEGEDYKDKIYEISQCAGTLVTALIPLWRDENKDI